MIRLERPFAYYGTVSKNWPAFSLYRKPGWYSIVLYVRAGEKKSQNSFMYDQHARQTTTPFGLYSFRCRRAATTIYKDY
jgi:hypothetical protein